MAVVMSLTGFALAVATPLSPTYCVLIIGVLSIVYCTLGGVEAVIWYLLGYLELIQQHYTGCNPYGMMLTHDKAIAKKILKHHRIRVPDFTVFPRNRTARKPAFQYSMIFTFIWRRLMLRRTTVV